MPAYRAFLVDKQGHTIGRPKVLDCTEDDAAINKRSNSWTAAMLKFGIAERFITLTGPNGVKVRH